MKKQIMLLTCMVFVLLGITTFVATAGTIVKPIEAIAATGSTIIQAQAPAATASITGNAAAIQLDQAISRTYPAEGTSFVSAIMGEYLATNKSMASGSILGGRTEQAEGSVVMAKNVGRHDGFIGAKIVRLPGIALRSAAFGSA